MSVLSAEDRANPDSILYYAPPRYRRARGDASIRPVLERLSRGERSPSLLPDIPDDDMLAPPDLSVLAPDRYSVVGKAVTVAVCLTALAAPSVYFFASGGELHISAHKFATSPSADVATPAPERRSIEQPMAAKEPAPVAAQPVIEPEREVPVPAKAAETSADIDVLIAPLRMWGMFPTETGAAMPFASSQDAKVDNVAATAAAAPPTQAPRVEQGQRAPRQRRARRAHMTTSQAGSETTDGQTASAQKTGTQTAQVNPIQAAFRAIFGAKQ